MMAMKFLILGGGIMNMIKDCDDENFFGYES